MAKKVAKNIVKPKKSNGDTDIKIPEIWQDHRLPYAREKSIMKRVDNWLADQERELKESKK